MLRLAFCDHYPSFRAEGSRIFRSITAKTPALVCDIDANPDLLIYGDFGNRHWGFNGLKVYVTGENMKPDFAECDLAFTPFEFSDDERGVRLPFFAQVLDDPSLLLGRGSPARHHELAEGFCSFVVSNPRSWTRNRFFKKLNRRRRVTSGGSLFNNIGGRVSDKSRFISSHRFNIAFENTETNGYITEKLTDPLLSGTIPIYWGAPDVLRDFNPDCFIHAREFAGLDELADFVIALDSDHERQFRYLSAPAFKDDKLPRCLLDEHVFDPIMGLLKDGKPGKRTYRKRRVREHVYESRSWLANKWERIGCRIEEQAWKFGWRL
jgi:hypothetical protein